MSSVEQFLLPDVGEGLTEAEIVRWLVAPGDRVEVNQAIVEIETAKSVVELPSPFAGEVAEIHADEGQTVEVGQPIIGVRTGSAAAETTPAPAAPEGGHAPPSGEAEDAPQPLVGYGARASTRRRRGRAARPSSTVPEADRTTHRRPHAKPPVRKLAKDLGVDLTLVDPTGADRIIVRADVLAAASRGDAKGAAAAGVVLDHTASDPSEIRVPIKGVRKRTAEAMVSSAFTAPHVTEFLTLDMTRTMGLRAALKDKAEFADVKLSPLALVARAFLFALGRTPEANARWDEQAQQIVQFRDVNLGIAAATPRGLVVPNIKAAQRLSLRELAAGINDLAATARAGRTEPASMTGGTATITNVGVFGVDTGTPILNPGETVILAFGAVRRRPWVVTDGHSERIEARWITELALSFDHRAIDGQQGSQILADTGAMLTEPGLAML